MNRTVPTCDVRKKTPSMRRRDQRRWEDFQAKKSETPSNIPVAGRQPPGTDSRPEQHSSGFSHSHDSETEAMETNDNASETKKKPNLKSFSTVQSSEKIPPIISPLNTPQKNKISTKEINKPSEIKLDSQTSTQTEELKIMLCAPNKTAATSVMKKFPLSAFEYATNNKNHFVFSTNLLPSQIKALKKDPIQFIKLPHNVNIVNYFIPKEEKVYHPEEKKHCPGCAIFD